MSYHHEEDVRPDKNSDVRPNESRQEDLTYTDAGTPGVDRSEVVTPQEPTKAPAWAQQNRRLVASALALTAMLAGVLSVPATTSGTASTPAAPVFTLVEGAFGMNASSTPLRACATGYLDFARVDESGFNSRNGDATTVVIDNVAQPVGAGQDPRFDIGVVTRGTIDYTAEAACLGTNAGQAFAVADLDGDLLPELTQFTTSGLLMVFWNEGGGRFTREVVMKIGLDRRFDEAMVLGQVIAPVATVDANDDGLVDIVGVSRYSNEVYVLFNDGNRKFSRAVKVLADERVDGYANSIGVSDLNRDGLADLVVALRRGRSQTTRGEVTAVPAPVRILYGTGDERVFDDRTVEAVGTLQALFNKAGIDGISFTEEFNASCSFVPTIADFDNDGLDDIYIAADCGVPRMMWSIDGEHFEDKTEESGLRYDDEAGLATMGGAAYDFNEDGLLDIFSTDTSMTYARCNARRACDAYSSGGNRLWINNGDRTFRVAVQEYGLANSGWAWGFAITDLNLDGENDILIGAGDEGISRGENQWPAVYDKPYLFLGDSGKFIDRSGDMARLFRNSSPLSVVVAPDVDGDFRPDLILGGFNLRAPYLLLNRTPGVAAGLLVRGGGRGMSPRNGEGAKVEVVIPGGRRLAMAYTAFNNFLSVGTNMPLMFALGGADHADAVVTFPSGRKVSTRLQPGKVVVVNE